MSRTKDYARTMIHGEQQSRNALIAEVKLLAVQVEVDPISRQRVSSHIQKAQEAISADVAMEQIAEAVRWLQHT